MTVLEPHRTALQFPVGSPQPPKFIRAVADVTTDPKDSILYHRDDFEVWTRNSDGVAFIWEEINHYAPPGTIYGRHLAVPLVEVVGFTREHDVMADIKSHLGKIEEDLNLIMDRRWKDAPLGVLAMLASAQRELRGAGKMLGVWS